MDKGLELLRGLDYVFKKNGIPWWIDFGTLLGQHYYNGIIPWDCDFDIGVFYNIDEITSILAEFCKENQEFGFAEITFPFRMIKFHSKNSIFPFVDIFFYEISFGKLKTKLKKEFIRFNDIFPLKRGIFEGLSLSVPFNEKVFLRRYTQSSGKWSKCISMTEHRNYSKFFARTSCSKLKEFFHYFDFSTNCMKFNDQIIYKIIK